MPGAVYTTKIVKLELSDYDAATGKAAEGKPAKDIPIEEGTITFGSNEATRVTLKQAGKRTPVKTTITEEAMEYCEANCIDDSAEMKAFLLGGSVAVLDGVNSWSPPKEGSRTLIKYMKAYTEDGGTTIYSRGQVSVSRSKGEGAAPKIMKLRIDPTDTGIADVPDRIETDPK